MSATGANSIHRNHLPKFLFPYPDIGLHSRISLMPLCEANLWKRTLPLKIKQL
jgi:hypothetical protein